MEFLWYEIYRKHANSASLLSVIREKIMSYASSSKRYYAGKFDLPFFVFRSISFHYYFRKDGNIWLQMFENGNNRKR